MGVTIPTTPAPDAAGTGLGFVVTGWAAVAALTVAVVAVTVLASWVLTSTQRTARLTRIINALRGNTTHPRRPRPVRARPEQALTKQSAND